MYVLCHLQPGQVSPTQQQSASTSSTGSSAKSAERRGDQTIPRGQETAKEKTDQKETAPRTRSIDQGALGRKIAEIGKLNTKLTAKETELKQLQEDLDAKEVARKELQTKLDRRDIDHDEHLKTRLAEVNADHEKQLEEKDASLKDALDQVEKMKQAQSEELAKTKAEYEKDLAIKQEASMNSMKLCVAKETEINSLKKQLGDIESESQKELEQLEQRVRKAEQQLAHSHDENTQIVEGLKQEAIDTQSQLEEMKKKSELEAETKDKRLADTQAKHTKTVEDLERQLTEARLHLGSVEDLKKNYEAAVEEKMNEKQQLTLEHEEEIKRLQDQLLEKGGEVDNLQKKLAENNGREIDAAQARLKTEFEQQMTEKVQQIQELKRENQNLSEEIQALQQEAQEKNFQLEQRAVEDEVVEAKLKDGIHEEDQQSAEELRTEIEAEVEKKHLEKVARAVEEARTEQADKLNELSQKLESAGKESDLRVERLKKQHEQSVKAITQRHKAEINKLHQQRETATEKTRKLEQSYMAKLKEKLQEADQAKTELDTHVELLRQVQEQLDHSRDQYGQLQVLAEAKPDLPGASSDSHVSILSVIVCMGGKDTYADLVCMFVSMASYRAHVAKIPTDYQVCTFLYFKQCRCVLCHSSIGID